MRNLAPDEVEEEHAEQEVESREADERKEHVPELTFSLVPSAVRNKP